MRKLIYSVVCAAGLCGGAAFAASPVYLSIDPGHPGPAITENFVGISFGMRGLPADKTGGHFFSATNTPLVNLFRNTGLTHLRVGGTTVESPPSTPIPNEADIESLFGFAKAAGVAKVIYSFRLLETNESLHYATTNAALARYIWDHYSDRLDCFAIGNEPDVKRVYQQDWSITNFDAYIDRWKKCATAIAAAVPEAKFCGPDAGSANVTWTTNFAAATKDIGRIAVVTEHFYNGAAGRGVEVEQGIKDMLSPKWIKADQKLYNRMAVPVMADGLSYRFTEANDHYSGGAVGVSDTFAGALWALDFLHWWAAHEAKGVDFHNTQWVVNDILTRDREGALSITPKGYGIRAFDLGGHGNVLPIEMTNDADVNLTAYAVGSGSNLFVTIINKEYGPAGRDAEVTIAASGINKKAEAIYLASPGGDVTIRTGMTLGGGSISSDRPWLGKWISLKTRKGKCILKVAAASAVVIKLSVN